MEEFWKSVKICQNYSHEFDVQFLADSVYNNVSKL